MITIQNAMLEEIQLKATILAREHKQTVGEKNDYYITLEQLEKILMSFQD
jgi:hypothetical protein